MLISMFAWVLRWLLLAYGNPGAGFPLILLSMFIWGMAFDFFNLSGSLYIETQVPAAIRSSAQGLYQVMVIGVGTVLGSHLSGWVIDEFFTTNGLKNWHAIMLTFAGYSLVIAILFMFLFRYKHNPKDFEFVRH